jgi:3-deoxy-manno-octulosonate cytidylyltransferase (CMP-KDO synthetase)
MIDEAVVPFDDEPDLQCVNLTKRITTEEEFNNPNTIKVTFDDRGNALYMSRAPIPALSGADLNDVHAYKQVCIMPFQCDALRLFSELPPTPLEIAESIDMNRFLEHGIAVRMVKTEFETHAVDTPQDLAHVENVMAGDSLLSSY